MVICMVRTRMFTKSPSRNGKSTYVLKNCNGTLGGTRPEMTGEREREREPL